MAFSRFNVAGRRFHVAHSSHLFNNLAAHSTSVLPVYQTSGSRLTYKPVVYVAFDKDSAAWLFPLREDDSVEVCFF